jgi:hypothetical protein
MDYLEIVGDSLLRNTPGLVAWVVGIVWAALMVRRGGGRTEKLLLSGCCLFFAAQIISVLLSGMVPWLREQRISAQQFGLVLSISGIPSLAGLVCLVWAFWVRFWTRRKETAK